MNLFEFLGHKKNRITHLGGALSTIPEVNESEYRLPMTEVEPIENEMTALEYMVGESKSEQHLTNRIKYQNRLEKESMKKPKASFYGALHNGFLGNRKATVFNRVNKIAPT